MAVQRRPKTGKPKTGRVRWVVRNRDATGKEVPGGTFYTEKEAKAADVAQKDQLRRGTWIAPDVLATPVKELVEERRDQATNQSSKNGRSMLLANLGDLKDMPVGGVKPSHVRAWMQTLEDGRPWANGKPLKPSTVQMLAALLHGVFTQAVNDDVVARHPMRGVKISRVGVAVQRDDVPTVADVQALIKAANGTAVGRAPNRQLARMIQVAAETGLRAGELCGVRVRSVDFLRRELRVVEQTSQRTGEFAPLKTQASVRTIPLSDSTIQALDAQLRAQPRGRDETVFASKNGRALTSTNVGAQFRKVAKLAGVDTTFHALRHFYASQLLEAGVQVKTVQKLLGHATASMTLDVYGHLMPGAVDDVRGLVSVRAKCGQNSVSSGAAAGSGAGSG